MSKKTKKEDRILNSIDEKSVLEIRRKYLYLFIFAKLTKFKIIYNLPPFFSTMMKGIYHKVLTKRESIQMNIAMGKSSKGKASDYRTYLSNKIRFLYGNDDIYAIYNEACNDMVEMISYSSDEYFKYDLSPIDFNVIPCDAKEDDEHVAELKDMLSGEFILCSRLLPSKTKSNIMDILNKNGIVYIPEEFLETKHGLLEFAKLMLSEDELREEGIAVD